MDLASYHYTYGRIAPSPMLKDTMRAYDPDKAFDWYFQDKIVGNADHLAARPGAYVASLDATIDANPHLRSLPANTLLIVTIPVNGDESGTIYQTLKHYTTQGRAALRRTQFVLLISRDETAPETEFEATYNEIMRAQQNFPELRMTLLSIAWPDTFAKRRSGGLYSAALKIVTDTCMRAAQRAGINPLIITNDANARTISRNYLLHYMRALHKNPTADVFLGKIHWDTARMRSVPGYGFTATVLMAAQDRLRESRRDMPLDSWAANSGYRAAALAAVGGVDANIGLRGSERGFGADIDLGRRFFAARGSNDYFCMVHEAWVDSYGDRLLRQYICNKSLTRAWDECDNNASNNELKLFVDMTENIATDFDYIRQRIEQLLSSMMSDQAWVCFDDDGIIAAALNTVLIGARKSGRHSAALWSMHGNRHERKLTFTSDGSQRLRELLPQLGDTIQAGLAALDDMQYSQLRANRKILTPRPKTDHSLLTQKRRIGSQVLTVGHPATLRK